MTLLCPVSALRLHRILVLRDLGVPLAQIGGLIYSGSLDVKILIYRARSLDVKRYSRGMPRRTQLVSDEVDDIVARWRAERPDLDVAPMQVLSRVSRLARHLDRARRAAFAARGLETWEFDVLSALRRQGTPYQLSPGALLRVTLVTSGTMTNRIDRLEASGLVRRRHDPQDKRGVLVELTRDGIRRVDAAVADLLARERELLAGLAADQQEELASLLRVLLAPFDTASAGTGPASTGPASTGPATAGAGPADS